jgi:hypothetical protein
VPDDPDMHVGTQVERQPDEALGREQMLDKSLWRSAPLFILQAGGMFAHRPEAAVSGPAIGNRYRLQIQS